MELNADQLLDKLAPILDHCLEGVEGPVSDAVRADVLLGVFVVVALEFVNREPSAVMTVESLAEFQVAENTYHMPLPIPTMFRAFYDMRLKELRGEDGPGIADESDAVAVALREQANGQPAG